MHELMTPTAALLRGFELAAPQADAIAPTQTTATTSLHVAEQREGFVVGNLSLMIRYEDGSELAEMPPVFALPNAPAWFIGMTNLHGALVPVFDPAPLLGVAHAKGHKQMLLVLGHGDERTGMVIDGLPSRLRLQPQDRLEQANVPQVLRDCVGDVYRIGDVDWMDFHHAPLFDRLEAQLRQ